MAPSTPKRPHSGGRCCVAAAVEERSKVCFGSPGKHQTSLRNQGAWSMSALVFEGSGQPQDVVSSFCGGAHLRETPRTPTPFCRSPILRHVTPVIEATFGFPQGPCELRKRFCQARRRVFPARLAEGNERLQDESLLSFDVEADGETVTVEAMLPQERDLDLISRLLAESFMETLQPWMLPEQLGLLAKAWNWLVFEWERQIILAALNVNYKKILTAPSLRRPIGWQFEGESLALLLVARRGNGDQEAVAFCELSVLPPDGRPPDDMLSTLLMVFNKSPNAQPYLQNFCVAPAWRRRSLGRKLLGLAGAGGARGLAQRPALFACRRREGRGGLVPPGRLRGHGPRRGAHLAPHVQIPGEGARAARRLSECQHRCKTRRPRVVWSKAEDAL
ncbi:unnamed protein product [Effrenium voratum]|nr:unnamed protein product [Effrenium voratum]